MSILFGVTAIFLTLFLLVVTWVMWEQGDIPQALVYTFVSAFILIRWYEVIFNG